MADKAPGRPIKQIAVAESVDSRVFAALCEDGSVWYLNSPIGPDDRPRWKRLEPIPTT